MPNSAIDSDLSPDELRDGRVRIAVLTDAHVADMADPREWYLRAVVEAARSLPRQPDLLVFLGDLRAAGRGDASIRGRLAKLLRDLPCPCHVLRGNTDLDAPPARFARVIKGLFCIGVDTADGTYSADEDQWLDNILMADAGLPVVLMTHYYPEALDHDGEACLRHRLEHAGIRDLICGHGHRAERRKVATATLHLVPPIDPYKPGTEQPGFDLFTLTTETCEREHRPVSQVPANADDKIKTWLGFALSAECVGRDLADVCHAGSLKLLQVKKAQDVTDIEAIEPLLRCGQLTSVSLHVSTPCVQPAGRVTNRETIDRECAIARTMRAVSMTTHLPNWDAGQLFDAQDRWRDTEIGHNMIETLSVLWAGFWRAGIRIDIENTHWYDPATYPDLNGDRQLGVRPAHLLAFREHVEENLRTRWGDVPGAAVACCLDVGHVLTNGPLADHFILTDWFEALEGHIASFHLHDVVADTVGGRQGHQPLGVAGGLMNLEGFLSLKHRHAPAAPAYLEVETTQDVLNSAAHLRRWLKRRRQPRQFLPAVGCVHVDQTEYGM